MLTREHRRPRAARRVVTRPAWLVPQPVCATRPISNPTPNKDRPASPGTKRSLHTGHSSGSGFGPGLKPDRTGDLRAVAQNRSVHETIHFNQTFQSEDNVTLLQGTVTEGTADFIASLVLPEPNVRQYTDRWEYGCAHEAELDTRYEQDEDVTKMPPLDVRPQSGHRVAAGHGLLDGLPHRPARVRAG